MANNTFLAELPFLESGASSDNLNGRWQGATGTFGLFRRGGGSLFPGNNNQSYSGGWTATGGASLTKGLVGNYANLFMGYRAFNVYLGSQQSLIRVNLDLSPDANCPQAQLVINADGSMQMQLSEQGLSTNNSNNFTLSGRPLAGGVFYYLELGLAVTNNNTLTADVWVNDQHLLTSFNHTFSPGFNTNRLRTVTFSTPGNGGGALTDMYISQNGFYGDGFVLFLASNNNGNFNQWTPSNNNTPNWQLVNNYPPNNNGNANNYVSANNVNQTDAYELQPLPANFTTIKAVQAVTFAEKDNANAAGFQGFWISGANNSNGNQQFFPSVNNYTFFLEGSENSIFTNNSWNFNEINAIQFGQIRTT